MSVDEENESSGGCRQYKSNRYGKLCHIHQESIELLIVCDSVSNASYLCCLARASSWMMNDARSSSVNGVASLEMTGVKAGLGPV